MIHLLVKLKFDPSGMWKISSTSTPLVPPWQAGINPSEFAITLLGNATIGIEIGFRRSLKRSFWSVTIQVRRVYFRHCTSRFWMDLLTFNMIYNNLLRWTAMWLRIWRREKHVVVVTAVVLTCLVFFWRRWSKNLDTADVASPQLTKAGPETSTTGYVNTLQVLDIGIYGAAISNPFAWTQYQNQGYRYFLGDPNLESLFPVTVFKYSFMRKCKWCPVLGHLSVI